MRRTVLLGVLFVLAIAGQVAAQQAQSEGDIRRNVPYWSLLAENPTLTLDQYNRAVREVARGANTLQPPPTRVQPRSYSLPTYTPRVPAYQYTPPEVTSSYDARSGNRYRSYAVGEDTVVRGSNLVTGSTWRTLPLSTVCCS